MSSTNKIAATFADSNLETLALSNFNFDFSMFRIEPPERVSEILVSPNADLQSQASDDVFTSQAGADATTIWAAATSGKSAIAAHLLACMLARMWSAREATCTWVEIIQERKREIVNSFNDGKKLDIVTVLAARINSTRTEFTKWDASARAWIRTADQVEIVRQ